MEIRGVEIEVREGKKNKRYCLVYDNSDAARLLTGGRRMFMINIVVSTNYYI